MGNENIFWGYSILKEKKCFSGPIREAAQVSLENEVRRRQSQKNPAQLFSCQRGSTVLPVRERYYAETINISI